MAGRRGEPFQTQSDIDGVPGTAESPLQASIRILDDVTAPLLVKKQNKWCSNFKSFLRVVIKISSSIIMALLFFLIFSFVIVAGLPVWLVLLLGSFVALTLVQLIRHGKQYDKASRLKFLVRFWFCSVSLLVYGAIPMIIDLAMSYRLMEMSLYEKDVVHYVATQIIFLIILDFLIIVFLNCLQRTRLVHYDSSVCVHEATFEIADCLVSYWGVCWMTDDFASVKEHKLLGLYTLKWIHVVLLVIIGCNMVRLCTHLSAWLLQLLINGLLDAATIAPPRLRFLVEKLLVREFFIYFVNGLKSSVNFILGTLLMLLTWVFYFGSHLSKTPEANKVLRFGTQTFLSLLICSILWLLKTFVVLHWEANAMYTRLRYQIIKSRSQLYFLGILGRHTHDIFKLTYYESLNDVVLDTMGDDVDSYMNIWCCRCHPLKEFFSHLLYCCTVFRDMTSPGFFYKSPSDKKEVDMGERMENRRYGVKKLSAEKRKRTKYDLLHNRTPSTHDIKQMADYLISAKEALSDPTYVEAILTRLTEEGVDIKKNLKQLLDENSDESGIPSSQVTEDDWKYFEEEVLKNEICSEIWIQTWLEKQHDNCLFLANALSSTKEVAGILNMTMSCLLIGVTFILWLLTSGLETSTVLVLLASPLLAASFIFADTCKTLFQGIMYVYVVHPIHGGDFCSVDGRKMVVKAVGVWSTSFCKVENLGTLEEVTYPNSELAKKVIINHLNKCVWDDSIEFNLEPLPISVKRLKKQIIRYLNEGEDEFVPRSYNVVVQSDEHGDLKIIIKLKYTINNIQNWSYLKCVRNKDRIEKGVNNLFRPYKESMKPSAENGSEDSSG